MPPAPRRRRLGSFRSGAGLPTIDRRHVRRRFGHERSHPPGPRQRQPRVGGLLDVRVPFGLPPIGTVNLGKLTFSGDCTTDPSDHVPGAGITLFNGFLGGTGLTGTVSTRPGVLHRWPGHPASRTGPRQRHGRHAGEPAVRVARSRRMARPDPPLPTPSPPAANEPPRTAPGTTPPDEDLFRLPTITCPTGVVPITGSINWPGAFPGISLGGCGAEADDGPLRLRIHRTDQHRVDAMGRPRAARSRPSRRIVRRRGGDQGAAAVRQGHEHRPHRDVHAVGGRLDRLVGRRRHQRAIARDRRHHAPDIARRARDIGLRCLGSRAAPLRGGTAGRRRRRSRERSPGRTSSRRR